ncbi:MAG: hypothetical protein ACTHQQ_14285 [Solirubrobacteraceae bacterium]
MRFFGGIALASTVLFVAGCGSGSSGTATGSQTPTTHAAKPPHRHKPSGVGVGVIQPVHAGGSRLSVRVSKVINPLRDSGAALPPGERAVGVLVSILNHGPAVYDSSSTTDVSLASSKGAGTPVFAPQGVCETPLRNWDNYIVADEAKSGCVSFAVGSGAKVTAVRFSPHGQAAGRVSWRVG